MSVSGGCNGLPDQPRSPLNVRPFSVSVGLTENFRTAPPLLGPLAATLVRPSVPARDLATSGRRLTRRRGT